MIRVIKNLLHNLIGLFWAARFGFPAKKLTVIGVTGTDGKTTTTTMIYHILIKAGIKSSMITSVHAEIAGKTYDTGFHVTTPNSYYVQKYLKEAVDFGDTHMVLEVTSHALSQHRVAGVSFAVSAITNVTHEHLDYHKSFADYLHTKLKLFKRSQVVVVNNDDAHLFNAVKKICRKQKIITYGLKRKSDVMLSGFPLKLRVPGEFNVYNALAAAGVATQLGISKKIILDALSAFGGVKGRMEVVATKPFTVVVDFAHTPNAIEQALKTLRAQTKKKLIHVFGSAGLRDHSKRPLMGKASAAYADMIVLTEEDYRTEDVEQIMDQITTGITKKVPVYRYPNRHEALVFALSQAKSGDTIAITGKGHEQSLCRGRVEYPWSDQEEVKKLLATR